MTPASCKEFVLKHLAPLPDRFKTNIDKVLVAMMTIGYQESLFIHRYQVLKDKTKKGPARGFWQMEKGGGVIGVMNHKASKQAALDLCKQLGLGFNSTRLWEAMETNDYLAACFARLLLYTDPKPLPELNEVEKLWEYYLWNWRPGAYTNGTPKEKAELKAKFLANHKKVLEVFNE